MNRGRKMSYLKVICICVLLVVPGLAFAQDTGGLVAPVGGTPGGEEVGAGLETPVDAETYVLGPGDSLLVTLTGSANYAYGASITPEGKLFLMMPISEIGIEGALQSRGTVFQPVDQIQVSGMTIAEAQRKTNEVASRYLKNSEIVLTLMGMPREPISTCRSLVFRKSSIGHVF